MNQIIRITLELEYPADASAERLVETAHSAVEYANEIGLFNDDNGNPPQALRAHTQPDGQRHTIVCQACRSQDVAVEGVIRWSNQEQRYEVVEICDKGHVCEDCGGETRIEQIVLSA